MIKRISFLSFVFIFISSFLTSQEVKVPIGHKNNNKFKQLYEEFSTPNTYRTASGSPGNDYYQQKVDYSMDIILDDENSKLYGNENINYKNNISAKIWEKTALQSRKCYMGPYTPSSTLDTYHPNIPLEYAKKDPEKTNSEEGYENFVHVELSIIDLDILQLHHDGHIRFKVVGEDLSFVAP